MRDANPTLGADMTQTPSRTCRPIKKIGAPGVIVLTSALWLVALGLAGNAAAQVAGVLSYAPVSQAAFSSDDGAVTPGVAATRGEGAGGYLLPERLRRTVVALDTSEAPGTIIIDTGNTALYYVVDHGHAIRYGVGVGRDGFTWSGVQTVAHKAEWPDWHPPAQMIARQPYLPRFMAGGPGNPLGARAIYLGSSEYRIHGTNDPATIGKFVSSGCIRLTNEDVIDLFNRVSIGTKVVVLPKNAAHLVARELASGKVFEARARPAVTTLPSGRQAMNLSTSQRY
jgi:lipoprotein-anchoring transpeptidase ErfK/SrfK